MRTLLRVGGIAGMLAGALALALAPRAGLMVIACLVAAGLAVGLAVAKWLPRTWYGRQFGAGLRAGLIACVIAVPATLLGLLNGAPHDAATLAARTVILASPLGAAADAGWVAADVVTVIAAALAALALAALTARIFAGSKGTRFVTAVTRAREASKPLREEGVFARALSRRTAVPLAPVASGPADPRLLERPTGAHPLAPHGAAPRRTLAPVTPPEGIAGTSGDFDDRRFPAPAPMPADVPAPPRRNVAPAPRALPPAAEPEPAISAAPTAPAPAPVPVPAPDRASVAAQGAGAPALKRRGGGRPAPSRLTPEMLEALAVFARETEEDDGAEEETGNGTSASDARQPVESSYLNDPAPVAPKRKRKKNATRDWIC